MKLYGSLVGYVLRYNREFAREHFGFFERAKSYFHEHGVELEGCRILDVGCGKSHWLTLLLHGAGAKVTGIDTEFVAAGRSLRKYLGILRSNGFDRALRTFVWDWSFGLVYYAELSKRSGAALPVGAVDVRSLDVTRTDYPDDTFDLIVSHEVFEHIPDVEAAARELRRIMKPTGTTYIYFHSYTSISGGHHIAWKYPDTEPSTTVPPWDHLRSNLHPDIPSYINRLRVDEYRQAFAPYFQIQDWMPLAREGESQLTPEIRDELREYSEEELLTKGYIIVAHPIKDNTEESS